MAISYVINLKALWKAASQLSCLKNRIYLIAIILIDPIKAKTHLKRWVLARIFVFKDDKLIR
jgi:hypothetical protein